MKETPASGCLFKQQNDVIQKEMPPAIGSENITTRQILVICQGARLLWFKIGSHA
ncbi:hypothetical Protein YC6258_03409 [Gynuella sunshinyii YC6258]|uniref:Uncharacterized protein n=1 Tax=Gynuella sunshinyii YC6258 TaxID=1445510 RepID=A0A0C5V7P4_9GAMM|nr:hypothetical Protein YC6258_03409 [Gynuella sunshinyii YC6258]